MRVFINFGYVHENAVQIDFNFGAMENKGLNIFNSQYVLAHPSSATDTDFSGIEDVQKLFGMVGTADRPKSTADSTGHNRHIVVGILHLPAKIGLLR